MIWKHRPWWHFTARVLRSWSVRLFILSAVPVVVALTGDGLPSLLAVAGGYGVGLTVYFLYTRLFARDHTKQRRRDYLVPLELPPAPAFFVGREDELAELRRDLTRQPSPVSDQDRPRIIVVHGPAGIGKTALVIQLAHAMAKRFPHGQLFARIKGTTGRPGEQPALEHILASFIQALKWADDKVPEGLVARRRRYVELSRRRKVLVVLDDVATSEDVELLVPAGHDCAVLITTRHRLEIDSAIYIPIGALPDEVAVQLLEEIVGDRVAGEREHARSIAAASLNQPFALRMLGCMLATRPEASLEPTARLALDLQRKDSVGIEALDLTFELLTDEEQRAVRLIGLLGEDPFSASAMGALMQVSVDDGRRITERLVHAGFVERVDLGVAGAAEYRVLDQVLSYAKRRLDLDHLDPQDIAESQRRIDEQQVGSIDDIRAIQYRGELAKAVAVARDAVARAQATNDLAGEAYALSLLAEFQIDVGAVNAAAELAEGALSRSRPISDHLNEARALRCLGRIELRRHRFDAVRTRLSESLACLNQVTTPGDAEAVERLLTLRLRAFASALVRDAPDAMIDLNAAKDIYRRLPADLRDLMGVSLAWAEGAILQHARDHGAAETAFAAAENEARRRNQLLWRAWIQLSRAQNYLAMNDQGSGLALAQQAMRLFGGMGHRYGKAQCQIELATAHQASHGLPAAVSALESALETFRICGDHWMEADAARRLAMALSQTDRRDEAVPLLRYAVRLFNRIGDSTLAKSTHRLQRQFGLHRWNAATPDGPSVATLVST